MSTKNNLTVIAKAYFQNNTLLKNLLKGAVSVIANTDDT
jgi:hypothetical protein